MIKIMFVCHGNICRSPMAELLFRELVKKKGEADKFLIVSSATSSEELGNPVHYGVRKILDRLNISYAGKQAVRLTKSDYGNYDFFVGMDSRNRVNMERIFGGDADNKISLLLDYTGENREVSDPWWTGEFEKTYSDISRGLEAFYEYLCQNKKI